MKMLADWGFHSDWWRGQRGEYWVIAQVILLAGFALLPVYRPDGLDLGLSIWTYARWGLAIAFGLGAFVLFGRSLLDLGRNLTPLPHPKDNAQLVQTGAYGVVRHPLYSAVCLAALSWAIWLMSLTHLGGAIAFFIFLDAKAAKEEVWLSERFPDYASYRASVKKLIPWIY